MKHKHHIIPKHAGGTDDPSNVIELTIEEHAEAHRVLFEQHGRWQDELAWKLLSKLPNKSGFSDRKHSEETKEALRKLAIENNWSSRLPILSGERNPSKNPEMRKAISIRMIGNKNSCGPKSEEHKRKIGLANKGKLKGRIPWNKGLRKK